MRREGGTEAEMFFQKKENGGGKIHIFTHPHFSEWNRLDEKKGEPIVVLVSPLIFAGGWSQAS